MLPNIDKFDEVNDAQMLKWSGFIKMIIVNYN